MLVDVYLADAMVSIDLGQDFENLEEHYGYYKSVFEKHNITPEAFEKAFNYYSNDPEKMQRILAQTLEPCQRPAE